MPDNQEIFLSKTPKVFKNTQLNAADFKDFNHNDYQVFLHLLSKVGGVDNEGKYLQAHQLEKKHTLTAQEFSNVFNVKIQHSYQLLHRAISRLMKTSVFVEKMNAGQIWQINICATACYNQKMGSITIEFTDQVMPYIQQAKERFVLYNLKEISNFKSIYSTRLYEILQEFKDTGWMVRSVEQLRSAFATGKKLSAYKDFKKFTFDHACREINQHYKMNLQYEEIKEGRKVVAIKFTFKKTKIIPIKSKTGKQKNFYIKPEQNIIPKKPKPSNKQKQKTSSQKINETLSDAPQDHLSNKKEPGVFSSFFSRFKK